MPDTTLEAYIKTALNLPI